MAAPDHQYESPAGDVIVGRFGRVFAGAYQKGISADALRGLRTWQREVMPQAPIISFSLSFAAERLQPDVRKAADALLSEFRDQTAAAATVMRVLGFEGSAARAMLATLYLVTRAAYPRKVFATLEDGQAWLRQRFADDDSVAAIEASTRWLSQFDRALTRRSPPTS